MIADFADPKSVSRVEADVLIAGSGPASMSLAKSLVAAGFSVVMLEGGKLEYDERSQALYEGRNLGFDYPIATSRLRQFGGTTGHWTGQCGRLRPVDLAGVGGRARWPIEFADLARWYPPAAAFLEIDDVDVPYTLARMNGDARRMMNWVWQYRKEGPLRIAERELPFVTSARQLLLLTDATVIGHLPADADGRIPGLKFRSLDGRQGEARARFVVLACGGLENPRLLMTMMADGLNVPPEAARHVGKYFMEHPNAFVGRVVLTHAGRRAATTYTIPDRAGDKADARPGVAVSPERSAIGSAYFRFVSAGLGQVIPGAELVEGPVWKKALSIAKSADEISFDVLVKLLPAVFGDKDDSGKRSRIFIEMEQKADVRNHIRLDTARDAVGVRKLQLDMKLHETESRTIHNALDWLGEDLVRNGMGRVEAAPWVAEAPHENRARFDWSWHHIGTTRMAASKTEGVVDSDMRLYGTKNMYVIGSSVFPSAGFANPTFTIVALSYRLAAHLQKNGAKTQLKFG